MSSKMEIKMTKHNDKPEECDAGMVCVLEDGQHRVESIASAAKVRVLDTYDATLLVGLRTIVCGAAIERVDESGEETIELPKPRELRASVAIARCLMPEKLQGWEIKAMRKIMGLTLAELAKRLDERTAPETVSRWEADAQPMGSYADKVLRLMVCEALRTEAPGIAYSGGLIANLKVRDPWRANPDYQVQPIVLHLIQLKEQSGSIIETWNAKLAA
jgi:DNA-binding transcriptional regulator YiaG